MRSQCSQRAALLNVRLQYSVRVVEPLQVGPRLNILYYLYPVLSKVKLVLVIVIFKAQLLLYIKSEF